MISHSALLIYSHPLTANAPTIIEHVESFEKYSKFDVFKVNTTYGFPKELESVTFSVIILHYALFGAYPFRLSKRFREYIYSSNKSVRIAFFQDEMQYCLQRFDLINNLNIDVVFSLLDLKYFDQVYRQNTAVQYIKPTLTGYVCDSLIDKANTYFKPFNLRSIDVGYRARDLPYFFGRGAREKADIAEKFIKTAHDTSLKIDISTNEGDRIYGDKWYQFVANCKFMLGVMAGTSIFDLTGEIRKATDEYLTKNPAASFFEVERDILADHEGKINYRTISPRIFECAALRTCMILYRDSYQGILTAGKHYIALEKDFSNINTVYKQMQNSRLVQNIIDNVYNDLIISEKYHYKKFVREFDLTLSELGCKPSGNGEERKLIEKAISKDAWLRNLITHLKLLRTKQFIGREFIKQIAYKMGYKKK